MALQETVSALQGTITALQTSSVDQTQANSEPSPQMMVVTATATPKPSPTSRPAEPTVTDTGGSTPTPTRTATNNFSGSSQRETIQLVATPTPLATLTPPLTATQAAGYAAPILEEPGDGAVVDQGRNVLLRWSWPGTLGSNERFDIKIRPDGQTASAYVTWTEDDALDWEADLVPGRYYWSVQVIRGYYENDSGQPEDRILEAFLGPESELRLIIVKEKPAATPRSVSQADPTSPSLFYGLWLGSVAFVVFAGFTRQRSGN